MLHKVFNKYISTSVHASLLACFSLSAVTPIYSNVPIDCYSECAFTVASNADALLRVKRSLKNLQKAQKEGSVSVLKAFMSIKDDLESLFNTKFDVDLHMNTVRSQLNQSNISTKYVDSIQRYIVKKTHSRSRKRALMETAYELEDFSFFMPIEAKKHKNKHEDEDDVEEIPASVTYGVTVMLCGCFLYVIPYTRNFGKNLIGVGLTTISSGICDDIDAKNREKAKEKKKKR